MTLNSFSSSNKLDKIINIRHNMPSLINSNVKVLLDKDAVSNYFKNRENITNEKKKSQKSNKSNRTIQTTILSFFKTKSDTLDNNHNKDKNILIDIESEGIEKESTNIEALPSLSQNGQCSIKDKINSMAKINSNPPAVTNFIEIYCNKCHKKYKSRVKNNLKYCLNCNSSLLFRCIKCDKTAERFASIFKHLSSSICDGYLYYNCNHCDYIGGSKDVIRKHLERMHSREDEKDYIMCTQCGRGFKCIAYLRKHKKNCGQAKKFKCLFCPYETRSQQFYIKHLKSHMSQSKNKNTEENSDERNVSIIKVTSNTQPIENEIIVDDNDNMPAQVRILPPQIDVFNKKDPMMFQLAEVWCQKCKIKENVTSIKPISCRKCKKQMLFRCKQCTRSYHYNSSFHTHLKNNCSMPRYFSCDHCNEKYDIKNNLIRHIFFKHMKTSKPFTKKLFKCIKCSRKYSKKSILIKHLKFCGMPKLFKCQFCSLKSHHKTSLRGHMKLKHKNVGEERREKILNKLAKVANSKMQENYEKIQHLIEEPVSTPNEKEGASNTNSVNLYSKHMYKNEWQKALPMMQFHCPKCKHSPEIKRPIPKICNKCKTPLKFKCLKCSKEYSSLLGLSPHIKLKHLLSKDQQKLYQCSKCASRFNFYYDLKSHWRMCMKTAADLNCDHCNFITKSRMNLIGHIKEKHMGIKRKRYFKCEGCSVKFDDVAALEKHWKKGCDLAVFGVKISKTNSNKRVD